MHFRAGGCSGLSRHHRAQAENGSRLKLQVMADKPVTVTREQTGRFGNQDMARLGIALAPAVVACGLAMLQSGRRTVQSASRCRRLDAAFSDTRQRYRAKSYSGAPRSMKMGTTRSLSPYDAAPHQALQSANPLRPAILRYTLIAGRAWPFSTVLTCVKRVPTATPVALSSRYSLGFPTCRAKGGRIYLRNSRRMTRRRAPARPTS